MGEEKLYFLLLKSVKRKKAQFRAKSQIILSPIVAVERLSAGALYQI